MIWKKLKDRVELLTSQNRLLASRNGDLIKHIAELEKRNIVLETKVDMLERQLEDARVWDKRSLDDIISTERTNNNTPTAIAFGSHKQDNRDIGCQAFMQQYREYRRLQKENDVHKEIELNTSAIDQLKEYMKQNKPA